MELTKANIDVGQVGQWEDPNTWQCTLQFFESEEEANKIKQQILDDYEKARQWDKAIALENRPDIATIMERNAQNQKLRELIDYMLSPDLDKGNFDIDAPEDCLEVCQSLLEDIKK